MRDSQRCTVGLAECCHAGSFLHMEFHQAVEKIQGRLVFELHGLKLVFEPQTRPGGDGVPLLRRGKNKSITFSHLCCSGSKTWLTLVDVLQFALQGFEKQYYSPFFYAPVNIILTVYGHHQHIKAISPSAFTGACAGLHNPALPSAPAGIFGKHLIVT